ncbi:Hypothetical_protein [Hexamita inflata]|uniref:Hypothetical_protein n=1 Tax=Hexamita inflata TaxID=28002 RepID=A0AA86R1E2_9EUKA|nr:Hypothetical protein HINF_LOCUS52087 [Hexamita inflata]
MFSSLIFLQSCSWPSLYGFLHSSQISGIGVSDIGFQQREGYSVSLTLLKTQLIMYQNSVLSILLRPSSVYPGLGTVSSTCIDIISIYILNTVLAIIDQIIRIEEFYFNTLILNIHPNIFSWIFISLRVSLKKFLDLVIIYISLSKVSMKSVCAVSRK